MATRVCESCGVEQDASERFCTVCHAYMWWDAPEQATTDSTGGGTTRVAVVSSPPGETATNPDDPSEDYGGQSAGTVVLAPPAPPPPAAAETVASPPTNGSRHAQPPEVETDTNEVTLDEDSGAQFVLQIRNPSSIVDGYDVLVTDAPAWLVVRAADTHMMPGEARQVAVSLTGESEEMILAQRLPMRVRVVSQADPSLQSEVELALVVPPVGPRLTMTPKPAIVRMLDAHAGEFTLVLDNHASNHPQSLELSASDPEGQVRFAFDRHRVTVRPGAIDELIVSFSAPAPDPGTEVTRQLTIVGGSPDGEVTATLSLALKTSPAPVDAPVRLQLSPAQIGSVNGSDAYFEIRVDNRGAHVRRAVTLAARDPRNKLSFAFSPRELVVGPGLVGSARARVRTAPPEPGTSISIPFTVTASDGQSETETQGQLDVTATPDPMSTAAVHVEPEQLRLDGQRSGSFRIILDNRRGVEPLRAHLSGSSRDGTATIRFEKADLIVPPQSTAAVHVSFEAPRPPARATLTRQITFQVTDGRQSISADAEVIQTTPDVRPIWSRILVAFGAIFVVVGALSVWELNQRPFLANLPALLGVGQMWGRFTPPTLQPVIESAAQALVLLLALAMALGMTGRAGRLTRWAAFLIVIVTVTGVIVRFAEGNGFHGPAPGVFVVWFGAILGYIGGSLARASARQN